jgi:hypothetical protein
MDSTTDGFHSKRFLVPTFGGWIVIEDSGKRAGRTISATAIFRAEFYEKIKQNKQSLIESRIYGTRFFLL